MTSGAYQQIQRSPLHQGFSGVPVRNLERYQRSWKLDVGFQKLQKRISERIKRENTLPPITFGSARPLHTSYPRMRIDNQHTQRTSQTRHTTRAHHRYTSKGKSEHSYSLNKYNRESNNGTARLGTSRLKRSPGGRRLASSIPCSCSFTFDEDTSSSATGPGGPSVAPALTKADVDKLNHLFEDSDDEEERITKWLKDCDVYNCAAQLPYQQKETVSFSKFKPKPPNTPRARQRNYSSSRLERSKTTL